MAYSYKIEQAIRAAAVLHKDQVRKGEMPFPVVTHLISVAMIVSEYTDDEDTIAAAFLHDALEDTDYTATEMEEDFGGNVKEIVEGVTEPQREHSGERVPWEQQKRAYIENLKKAPEASLLICAADKIHNMRTMVEDYYEDHSRFLADFGGKLERRIEVFTEISNVLNRRLKSPILSEFNHVFEEYKNFISDVKATKESF